MARLIDFSQIKGGRLALEHILELQTSYDAKKVITDILKGELPEGGTYNVNELLTELKTIVDEKLGDGPDTVMDQINNAIAALRQILEAEILKNKESIDAINGRVIKDRVKVKGTVRFEEGLIVAFAEGVEEVFESVVHEHGPYVAYGLDNKPLQNEMGDNITYDFGTGTLSGRPHVLDETRLDAMTYIPVEGEVAFKVFPVGSFTFETLPSDYLLDNEELNLIAYSKAIDEIVFNLSQDGELIEQIKQLVGDKAVQDQIKAITSLLEARIVVLETDLKALDLYVKNLEQTLNFEIQKILAVKEKTEVFAVATKTDMVEQPVFDEFNEPVLDVFGEPTYEMVESAPYIPLTYTLAHEPAAESPIRVLVNGVSYREADAFTADRVKKEITWTFTKLAGGFDLEEGFEIEVQYKHAEAVVEPTPVEPEEPVVP